MNLAMKEVCLWCQKHGITIHPDKSEADTEEKVI